LALLDEVVTKTEVNLSRCTVEEMDILVGFELLIVEVVGRQGNDIVSVSDLFDGFAAAVGVARTVSRSQLPITPAYAFTDYRAQGQTIDPMVIDIARPPTGGLTPFNVYVALSRGTSRDRIRLLRDFEDKLFTQHPSEHLRREDSRLDKLRVETEWWWEKRQAAVAHTEQGAKALLCYVTHLYNADRRGMHSRRTSMSLTA
jgi:hypothetical protein